MTIKPSWIVFSGLCLALNFRTQAAEPHRLTIDWVDSHGQTQLTTEIESARPITPAHVAAMTIKMVGSRSNPQKAATRMSVGEEPLIPHVINAAELSNEGGVEADWSGVRVKSRAAAVGLCDMFVQAYSGLLRRDELFVTEAGPAISVAAALTRVGKSGNPDLYFLDPVSDAELCSSTSPGGIPEDCAGLTTDCSNQFINVVVQGVGKKQKFALIVWETAAE